MATRKKAAKAKSKAAAKKSAKKVVKLKAKRPAAKAVTRNGTPRASAKLWGEAGRRSTACASSISPTCNRDRPARSCWPTGADVIKVERPSVGDITRGQLRDVKGADSLYFTMLNGSKRSITIDSKAPQG